MTPEISGLPMSRQALTAFVKRALAEDLGAGDLTTKTMIPEDAVGRATIRAKAVGVLAGTFVGEEVLRRTGAEYESVLADGTALAPGDVVARLKGKLVSLLTAERTCLNLLCRLSGIATLTSRFCDAVAGTRARILDTRKTVPHYRALEKYAVRTGGGTNHRMGLHDEVLVKENHVAAAKAAGAAPSFDGAIKLLAELPDDVVVGIEVEDLSQLHIALEARPAYILCDNFDLADLRLAVQIRDGWPGEGKPEIEASGGVTLENVAEIAAAGVERISVGSLTHSAPALDLSLDIE
ncbi:MAG: carboxylating nicotinate-nucleotide diphosphorylase [Planctomycetota bacterium]|jgi:nicotinate-nucleotide pyrophosphorylase (carboxylating)